MFRQVLSRNSARAWATPRVAGAVSSGEQIIMHRVKIQPARTRLRKLATFCMVGAVSLYVWDEIAFSPLKHLDDRPLPKGVEEEVEPIFIPFPFTEKQVQSPPYAGAEEEWQSFIAFSQNDKLRQRVKDDLSVLVKKAAEKNMIVRRWANKGEGFQLGPRWLIISFPERPPPEYVRWGLEWNDEGLFLKEQNVDPRTQALIDRVLKPYPVASASYAFAKAMVKHNVTKVASFFGYQQGGNDINTSGLNPEVAKTLSKLASRQTADGSTATGSSTSSSNVSTSSSDSESPAAGKPEDIARPDAPKTPGGSLTKDNIPYYQGLVGKGSGPWMAFADGYKRAWRPLRYSPPRGSLAVHGLIALDSPKGRVFIDVFAWYHPQKDEFHQDSLTMQLRSISPSNQRPRR